MKKRQRHHVQFTDKGYSRRGIRSLAESAVSLVWLIYALFQASRLGDQTGNLIGGIGALVLLLQFVAFVTAIRANREENVFRGIPKLAIAAAILLLLLWIAIYGLGIAMLLGVL